MRILLSSLTMPGLKKQSGATSWCPTMASQTSQIPDGTTLSQSVPNGCCHLTWKALSRCLVCPNRKTPKDRVLPGPSPSPARMAAMTVPPLPLPEWKTTAHKTYALKLPFTNVWAGFHLEKEVFGSSINGLTNGVSVLTWSLYVLRKKLWTKPVLRFFKSSSNLLVSTLLRARNSNPGSAPKVSQSDRWTKNRPHLYWAGWRVRKF